MLLLFWYIKARKGTTFFLDMQGNDYSVVQIILFFPLILSNPRTYNIRIKTLFSFFRSKPNQNPPPVSFSILSITSCKFIFSLPLRYLCARVALLGKRKMINIQ